MSKVSDYEQEIRDAIEVLEIIYPSQKEIATGEYPQVAEALDLAIAALRAKLEPGEPCEWCVPEAEFFVASALDSKHVRDTDEPNFCPNCGRRIDLIPSESTQSGAIRSARGDAT